MDIIFSGAGQVPSVQVKHLNKPAMDDRVVGVILKGNNL